MVRMVYAFTAIALVIAAGAPCAVADDTLKALPGFVDFDMKTASGGTAPQVEVNLPKVLLRIAAAAVAQEQPDLVEVLNALEFIRVQVYEMPEAAKAAAATAPIAPAAPVAPTSAGLDAMLAKLQQDTGWMQTVNVQDDDSNESVHCFMKTSENGNVQGLAVFVNDLPDSLVFVNIAGDIEPELLGTAAAFATQGQLDLSQLGGLLQKEITKARPNADPANATPVAPAPSEPPAEAAPIVTP